MPAEALPAQVEFAGSIILDELDSALEAETLSECRMLLRRTRQRVDSLVRAAENVQQDDAEEQADMPLDPPSR